MSETLISALCWVRKGYAQTQPKEFEDIEEEIDEIKK